MLAAPGAERGGSAAPPPAPCGAAERRGCGSAGRDGGDRRDTAGTRGAERGHGGVKRGATGLPCKMATAGGCQWVRKGGCREAAKARRGEVMGLPWGLRQGWKGGCSGGIQWSCDGNSAGLMGGCSWAAAEVQAVDKVQQGC